MFLVGEVPLYTCIHTETRVSGHLRVLQGIHGSHSALNVVACRLLRPRAKRQLLEKLTFGYLFDGFGVGGVGEWAGVDLLQGFLAHKKDPPSLGPP